MRRVLSWMLAGLLCVVLGAGEGQAAQGTPRSEKKAKTGGPVSPTASAPGSTPFTSSVFVQGNDWVGMTVQGNAVDDNGEYFHEDVLVVRNQTGLADAPLPLGVKYDLAAALDGDTVFFLNSQIVDEIFRSEQQGSLTPMLQAIAEPADPTPKGFNASQAKGFGQCSARVVGLGLTAQRDDHGRVFNASTTRTVTVLGPTGGGGGTWTAWLNRDAPSATGDWETLTDFISAGQVCANPTAIECRTTTGLDWATTGEVYSCSVSASIPGGVCVNDDQPDGQCLDYEVRFLCP
ncbi:hypothetical protein [Archangium sp.]|uniref:hypothetical protein n=1 Tax=Archangium sp. TaxID=1872627 RepID=UPI00286CF047|nr:hypothetical protein [Archangium sp.]